MKIGGYFSAVAKDFGSFPRKHRSACCTISWILALLIVVVAILLLSVSLKRVSSTEVGLYYDKVAKKFGDVATPGLHSGAPFFNFIKFPSVFVTAQVKIGCVSNDGLNMGLDVSFQYRLNQSHIKDIALAYRDFGKYKSIMNLAAEASAHWACAKFPIGDFQLRRSEVQNTTARRLQQSAIPLFATILEVQLRNVDYPAPYTAAVSSKERASYDIQVALNERNQSLASANGNLLVARQQASISLQNATTQESILQAQASNQATALRFQYQTEADTLAEIKRNLGLTESGLVIYLQNRLLESSQNRMDVSLPAPASLTSVG